MSKDLKDYKARTTESYNALAAEIVTGFEDYFESVARVEADRFLDLLGQNGTILDLGCGGGQASAYFISRGYAAIGADLSQEMLHACRRRGLRDIVRLDMEALPFRQCVFDAVWAHTSLIHVLKEQLAGALEGLGEALKPGGALFVALKEGESEGYVGKPGVERWFAHFQKGEFERYIPAGFTIVRNDRTTFKSAAFLNYHLRKKL
jgi:SAM-dependent methyltransferase